MQLGPGSTLGPYEVVEPLGAGGMGEVWKARDSRLDREVAVKIISHDKAADMNLQSRFGREAKTLSALNHPNIVSVYDVGEQSGTHYIVSELVRGESLQQVIARGALPTARILHIARQIAVALKAAHEAGIVHRDLKPLNIMVTADDTVKILDFGLARHVRKPESSGGETRTETIATQPGMVMGTAGYMSPEQICGEEADGRSDIFSFGVILYEMVTGKRAFPGRNSIEMLSAVLKDNPPELPAAVPGVLGQVVRRCLEKDPAKRFQNAADLSAALEAVQAGSGRGPWSRKTWMIGAAAAALVALGAGAFWLTSRPPAGANPAGPVKTAAVTQAQPSAPPPQAAAEPAPAPAVVPPETKKTPDTPAPPKKDVPKPSRQATPPAQDKDGEAAYQQAYEQGMLLLSQRKWADAAERLTEATRLKPSATPAYLGLCHAEIGEQEWEQAVERCTAAIQKIPDSADAYHQRAQAYFFLNQFEHVVEDMNAAIRLGDQNLTAAHAIRGRAHSGLKEWGDAIQDFDEAIKLNPDMPPYYMYRGIAYNARSQFRKALADFDEALRRQPNMPMALNHRAFAKQQLGDRAGAAADRERARSLRK